MTKYTLQDTELDEVISSFGGKSFSTYDFVKAIQRLFPNSWGILVKNYGKGGQGAGRHYSANSRVAQTLNTLATKGKIEKLDYRPSPPSWGSSIIRCWVRSKDVQGAQDFPNDLPESEKVFEGAKQKIIVNRYERDRGARVRCIEHWGIKCCACSFDFEKYYGERGAGFIHVHHLTQMSEIGEEHELDPINDLRPVCPNCHAMLHRSTPPITIEELRKILKKCRQCGGEL